MAQIIAPDKEPVDARPENGRNFKLAQLQEIVGGLIEILRLDGGKIMVINEEGKIRGLDYNKKATDIAYASDALIPGDCIVGTVLVCESREVH